MEQILNSYYENNSQKLRKMVDKVLYNLKFVDIDCEDFYSLANEVFVIVLRDYDNKQDFDGFLYSCLYKKFCTNMTKNTRDKRCLKIHVKNIDDKGNNIIEKEIIPDIRIDALINDENITYGDLIADTNDVESQVFAKEDREEWHEEVKEYLKTLSPLQKEIALMIADGYTPDEVCNDLNITKAHYNNSVKRIFSSEKIKILRPLVEKGNGT